MNKKHITFLLIIMTFVGFCQEKPNIIIIYADDLGYGDIYVNGAIGVKTPNIDKLAKNGINFTDAHTTSATCTPSRYSLLTGSYAFRNNAAILQGDAPLIIDTKKETMPKMLQKAGYKTAVVGKWHLGLGSGKVDWNKRISPGPKEVGFDYSFLIPATGDRVPCVFLENQKVVGLVDDDPITVSYGSRLDGYPKGDKQPHLLKQHTDPYHQGSVINGISRIGYMKGGKKALWIDEDFPKVLHEKADNFITQNKEKPFFLFYSLHDIHQPRVANIKFIEKSTMGPRGDVIAQLDWIVGKIVETLEKQNLLENTLLIFTSDNGPILDDGYVDYARELVGKHKPSGEYKGTKYSVFKGGTRVPTIVHFPRKVKPSVSNVLTSQVDLFASLASLVGQKINKKDAIDSENYMNVWLGKSNEGREFLLEEVYTFGLRFNHWKYIKPTNKKVPNWIALKYVDPAFRTESQLYNLLDDKLENENVAKKYPKIVKKMEQEMHRILSEKNNPLKK